MAIEEVPNLTSLPKPEDTREVIGGEDRALPVPLNDDEILKISRFAADLGGQIHAADRVLKQQKAEHKEETDPLKMEMESALRKVREGAEPREVYVEYLSGKVDEIRIDTGETLGRREMTDSERQRTLIR